MKEIVVISGKGGTGKTSITASFAYLARKNAVIADCDVDAADLYLILKPQIKRKEDFYSSLQAEINNDTCTNCGKCIEVCRFDAISLKNDKYKIVPLNCEGCGYCEKVCPVDAINMKTCLDGQWYISDSRFNNPFIHAKLGIGTENSGKLVALVKKVAKQVAKEFKKDLILVDGSPGVGCPVISSLSGADFVIFVTEPTVSGIHDLKRVFELSQKFNLPASLIINKSDLNSDKTTEIINFANEKHISIIGQIPYDEAFTKAMVNELTIVEYQKNELADNITNMWNRVLQILRAV